MPVVIAEVVRQRLVKEVLSCCPPKFWAKYVNDALFAIERSKVERLNSLFADIQFTSELEQDNHISL